LELFLKTRERKKNFPELFSQRFLSRLLLFVKGMIFLTPPFGSGVEWRGFFRNGMRKRLTDDG